MINKIFINNKLLLRIDKKGRTNYFYMDDNSYIFRKDFNTIEICCDECNIKNEIKFITSNHKKKKYICFSCNKKGERNSFFGKKHSIESKLKQRNTKLGMYDGEKNPFYGKKHTKETKEKISKHFKGLFSGEKNSFYGKKHTKRSLQKMSKGLKLFYKNLSDEDRQKLSIRAKISVNKFQKENPEYTIYIRRKAAFASALSQKSYKINKIEQIVFDKLKEISSDFKYSVILGYKQFDFGIKEHKILLEVQGDYWHGNPEIYAENKLNKTQIEKKRKDKIKKEFALKHGFKLFYIWEKEINNSDFRVLEKIKKEIKNVKF